MSNANRLLLRATSAFIDRTAIAWDALILRASAADDRNVLLNLKGLDLLRPERATAIPASDGRHRLVLGAVLVLSIVQTACALVILAAALASDVVSTTRLPQGLLGCAFTIGALALWAASRDLRNLYLVAWFSTVASVFARSAVHGLPEAWYSSIDVVFRGISPEAFTPACLWGFSTQFPHVLRFSRFDVIGIQIARAAWVLGLALFGINLIGEHAALQLGVLGHLLRGHSSDAFWHAWAIALIPAIGAILVRSRRAPGHERRKVIRLATAVAIGTGPFLFVDIAVVTSPTAREWLRTATAAERVWLDALVIGGVSMTPLLATAAVIVDRPFELRSLFHRASAFAVLRSFVSVAAAAPFTLLCTTLYQKRHDSLGALFSGGRAVPLLSLAATGCVLLAARRQLLRAYDRFVSRRAAEHPAELARALERIRLARGAREVVSVIETELQRGTGADAVRVLRLTQSGTFEAPPGEASALATDSALVAILQDASDPIDVSQNDSLFMLLPQADRRWVAAHSISMMTAVKSRDEAMMAVIAVGTKRSGVPFDAQDRWLITTLAATAATWIDAPASKESPQRAGREGDNPQSGETAFECPECGVVADSAVLPCSCTAASTLAALPAALHGKFVVQRRLGAGGMGIVYLAHDIALGRDVALKTLPRLAAGSVARLRDEARAMGALNHESLATIYGFEVWRRTPVLVVEYLPRGTLAQRLALGPIDPAEMIALGVSLGRALVYMHAHGVLHRDIKPSNIGFTAAGTAKLLDFGLAVLTEPIPPAGPSLQSDLPHLARAGTRKYLPPEAFHGASPSAAFDLWALSLALFDAVAADVRMSSPRLTHFFDRALDPSPQRRFQRATHLLAALEPMHTATH